MCDPTTAGLLIGGAVASGASGIMANSQNAAAGRHYNVQVAAQNALLNQEFQAKQAQIMSNQNVQNSEYETMTADQKAAFDTQTALANQKSGIVQDAVSAPGNAFMGTNSTTFDNAVANREALNTQGNTASQHYAPVTTGSAISDQVLGALSAQQAANRGGVTNGETIAQAKIGALQDTNQAQGQLFRNMNVSMGDVARQSQNTAATLASQERLPQEQINEQNAANKALLATPLFRGAEPYFQPPNSAISTILGKVGNIAEMAGGNGVAKDLAGDGGVTNYFTNSVPNGGAFAPSVAGTPWTGA